MSYEGWSQCLCEEGHLFNGPDPWQASKKIRCPHCNREPVVINMVDVTNGDCYGFIPEEEWERFLYTPKRVETCNLGHQHILAQATYFIPSEEEMEYMRTRVDEWKEQKVPEGAEYIPVRVYIKPRTPK
jgi:hypothetical protein